MALQRVWIGDEQHSLFPSGSTMSAQAALDSLVRRKPWEYELYHESDDPDDPSTDPIQRIDFQGSEEFERRFVIVHKTYHDHGHGHESDRR